MGSLSPVFLGTIILSGFLPAFFLRGPLEARLVLSISRLSQPRRQFWLDYGLCLLAGSIPSAYIYWGLNFPVSSSIQLMTGIIASGFFFGLEGALARQRNLLHEAASGNAVYDPPRTFHPLTRSFTFVAICSTLFIIVILGLIWFNDVQWVAKMGDDALALNEARRSVLMEIVFVLFVLLFEVMHLIHRYSTNLSLLFGLQTQVLEEVTRGSLERSVPVAASNEFGLIAVHTNLMIEALRHRLKLMGALRVAEQVQKGLLPDAPPHIPGVQIAAASLYCDETGGDYYDFIPTKLGTAIVIADVSGHGIGPALLMAAGRSSLRMASCDDPGCRLAAVNEALSRDVFGSGQFITLFYLEIFHDDLRIRWAKAGHDPALVYDPTSKMFQELSAHGLPLGVLETASFENQGPISLAPGSVIVLATDGIWEARGPDDTMFNKNRLKRIITEHADESAEGILSAIFTELDQFVGDVEYEDDRTLVVITFSS